jgi:mono/diheme cytochrome c family protein
MSRPHARLSALLVAAAVPLIGQNSSQIKAGEHLFALSCSIGYCHGVAGSAGHGPRLKDRQWDRTYLYKTIENGIPGTAMPAWKDKLSQPQISAVVSYVLSLSSNQPEATTLPMSATVPSLPVNQAGKELFFDPANNRNCGVCHRLKDSGGSVGPALDELTKKPQSEIRAYLSQKLASAGKPAFKILTASGETICGIKVREDSKQLQIFDLTSTGPPVLRTFSMGEIVQNGNCADVHVHAGFARLYSPAQLSAIAAFLKTSETQ